MTDTPAPAAPPSAASELFGDLPAPQTLTGFVNPGSGSYRDESGSLRYHRSPDQLEADHRGWMATFDHAARRAAFAKDEDMSRYSAEARAKRDADFRAAAKADGYDLPELVSPATVAHADRHMLPVSVSAAEYNFDVSAISTPETSASTRSEMGEMAAELGFLPGVGSGLLARIADNAKAIKGAPPEVRPQWGNRAREDMIRRLGGSEAEFDRQLAVIRDDLAEVKGKGRSLAQSLAKDVLLFDWYTFKTLYRQATAKESFYKTMPDR